MTKDQLVSEFEQHKVNRILWHGKCNDCGIEVHVDTRVTDKELHISGGALYKMENADEDEVYYKCDDCHQKDPVLRNFRPCEVYARVCGYLRPVSQWYDGKKEEFKMRKALV